jgi:hypothetical protein
MMIGRRNCILSWMCRRRTSLLVFASSLRHLVFVLGNCDYVYWVVLIVFGNDNDVDDVVEMVCGGYACALE